MVLMIRKYGHLVDKSWKSAVKLLNGSADSTVGTSDVPNEAVSAGAAAPAPETSDSRQEELVQSDAAAGDTPSEKKGGSSEAA